jgi:hypothetical protein
MADGDGPAQAWEGVLKIAGAVAGLAVLLYFVGAVTLWARFKAAGLPADKAVEHQPHAELIAVGVRGVAVVAAVLLILLVLTYGVLLISAWAQRRADPPANLGPFAQALRRSSRSQGERVVRGLIIAVTLVALALLIVLAATSWKRLALAIVAVTFFAVLAAYLRQRSEHPRPALWMIVVIALGVGLAGVCWQVSPPVLVPTVVVRPPPCTPTERVQKRACKKLAGVAVPYFGETDKHVFVAEIRDVVPNENGADWQYTHNVLELPRDKVKLIFVAERGKLSPSVPSPIDTARAFFESLS